MKKFILVLLVAFSFYLIFGYYSFASKVINTKIQIITIEKGENLLGIPKYIPMNSFFYKLYLRLNPPDFSLEAGKYQIEGNANLATILENFKRPIPDDGKITLLEGRNIYDIDAYLSDRGIIEAGSYVKKASENIAELKKKYDFLANASTLEGFLYPDTYNINPNATTAEIIIKKQLNTFQIKVMDKLEKKWKNKELLEMITLASIVEKEEKSVKNKPIVAGILKKRLAEGWAIGADATVCYPHALTSQECKLVVSKYIHEENGYNTRTMKGLPKTPIANPSSETIFATIESKETPYYFYLHGRDGQIHYATTNEEHEANKVKYME